MEANKPSADRRADLVETIRLSWQVVFIVVSVIIWLYALSHLIGTCVGKEYDYCKGDRDPKTWKCPYKNPHEGLGWPTF